MTAQSESRRPALRLIVTDVPRLSARKNGVQIATDGGAVVDPFGLSVTTLVGTLKKEHGRILAERPCEGPDFLVTLPSGLNPSQIQEAFRVLKAQGWEVWPGCLHNDQKIYLGNRADY
jgi:hypothetical protein